MRSRRRSWRLSGAPATALLVVAVDALAPLKRLAILVEKIPWVAAQHLRAANHVPTGCEAVPPVAL
jgi:hypothetical protein